ncbi:hypothetical protein IKL64_04735 [bacterium]|nr:hypothetical protein [bacterium]
MAFGEERIAIDKVNRNVATTETYVRADLGIKRTDEETKNVISSTFGMIKNNLEALWYSVGLDPNVNIAYENTMNDPNRCVEVNGKKFYHHPGVGNLRPYNEMGNPSGGCFSMQTMA